MTPELTKDQIILLSQAGYDFIANGRDVIDVMKWLYQSCGIFISVEPYAADFIAYVWICKTRYAWVRESNHLAPSPGEAVSEAIDAAIEKLNNKKK